jgi:peptidoglycan/LPS O-acetylase OafA/YrhL
VGSDHQLQYRADVDGLRAVAVLLVIGFHAFPARVQGGFIGVDVFFVISGFLIGGIIMQAVEQGSFSAAWFYGRRIRRIFPALALVLVASLAAGWFLLLTDEYMHLGKHVVGGAAFASNFVLWREAGYFDTASESKILLHLWSLGVEEQFYIVWPMVLVLSYRRRWNVAIVVAAVATSSFALNVARASSHPIDAFFLPFTRLWELLAGNLLAYVVLRKRPQDQGHVDGRIASNVMAVLGIGGMAVAALALDRTRTFPGWWALAPLTSTVLVVGAGPDAWINRYVLSSRPIVFVGLVSYPLYLWHWPLLVFLRVVQAGEPSRAARLAAVTGSFLLASLTYLLLERPIRTGGRSAAKTAGLCVAMAVITGLGAWVFLGGGMPSRPISERNARLEEALRWRYPSDDRCVERFEVSPCHLSVERPEVLLLGDSHANTLYPGLTEIDPPLGVVVVGNCGPFDSVGLTVGRNAEKYPCRGKDYVAVNERIVDTVPSLRVVVLSAFWRRYLDGVVENAREREQWASLTLIARRSEERDLPRFEVAVSGLARTIEFMSSRGKAVIFVRDVPDIAEELNVYCRLGRFAAPSECTVPRQAVDEKRTLETKLVERLQSRFPDLLVFDPLSRLCDANRCYLMRESRLLYRDHHHLSVEGSRRVGAALAELVREASGARAAENRQPTLFK